MITLLNVQLLVSEVLSIKLVYTLSAYLEGLVWAHLCVGQDPVEIIRRCDIEGLSAIVILKFSFGECE